MLEESLRSSSSLQVTFTEIKCKMYVAITRKGVWGASPLRLCYGNKNFSPPPYLKVLPTPLSMPVAILHFSFSHCQHHIESAMAEACLKYVCERGAKSIRFPSPTRLQPIFSLCTCDMSNLCGLQTHGSCF